MPHWRLRTRSLAYRCEPDIRLLEFPVMKYATNAAFANLDAWARQGVPAPRAEPLALLQDDEGLRFVTDEHGNAVGGLRSPWLEVPTATWHTNANGPMTCQSLGWEQPFGWARLEQLYGSAAGYSAQFAAAVERLVAERWRMGSGSDRKLGRWHRRRAVP